MSAKSCLALSAMALLWGCASVPDYPEAAFTDHWAHRQEIEERDKAKKHEKKIVWGNKALGQPYVYTDERGRPQMAIGAPKGFDVDVGVKRWKPSVELKYQLDVHRGGKTFPDLPDYGRVNPNQVALQK